MAKRNVSSGTTASDSTTEKQYQDYVVRVNPFHYLHVKDTNTNLVQLIIGPKMYTCLDHEKVVFGPEKMIIVPHRQYVVITNPVIKKKDDSGREVAVLDEHGQPLILHGDTEIRFEGPPFPLYDGEKAGPVQHLKVVEQNTALRLKAIRDFDDRYAHGQHRIAGEEWLFPGPDTYYPQVEVEILSTLKGTVLKSSQALKVKARDDCEDYQGKPRKAGEQWIVKVDGCYLPAVKEEEVEIVNATVLTYKNALHIRAKATFTDDDNINRKAGTEWLVTYKDTEMYIPGVNEVISQQVNLITLGPHDYCIIKDPVDKDNKPQLGSRKIFRGRDSFFLKPGESIEGACPQKSISLLPKDALWLTATEKFMDTHNSRNILRKPGQEWIIYGPCEYWPTLESKIQSRERAFIIVEPIGLYLFQPARWLGFTLLLIAIWIYKLF